jgi:hypothetical protein
MRNRVLCVDDNDDTCVMLSVLFWDLPIYQVATTGALVQGLELPRADSLICTARFQASMVPVCSYQQIRCFDSLTDHLFRKVGLDSRQKPSQPVLRLT